MIEYGTYGQPGGQCVVGFGGVVPCPTSQSAAPASLAHASNAPDNHNHGGMSDARMRCESGLITKAAAHGTATAVGTSMELGQN